MIKGVHRKRGTPKLTLGNNAKTFAAIRKKLETLKNDDNVNNYLARNSIKWQCNLLRNLW